MEHCFLSAQILMISLLFTSQTLCHCSLRSAATVEDAKNVSLTPKSSWRSWKRSTPQASSSPKTRGDAFLPPPTSQNARSPSGSRTDEWKKKSSSANPRAATCTPLDIIRDLPLKLQLLSSIMPRIYLLYWKDWRAAFGCIYALI